ncbi:MAG: O-antigen ligase family protein [Deltaproteobacteria bacterium]|nr:O-antigen ligase family protein [Deltaproteobacteria bacterium]
MIERYRALLTLPPIKQSDRWKIARTSIRLIQDRPFSGWGLGSYRFVFPEYAYAQDKTSMATASDWLMHPHNELLHQAAELGLLGLGACIGLCGLLYGYGIARLKTTQDRAERQVLLLALAGLTVSLTSWQFSTNFLFPLSRLVTACYVGMLWRAIAPSLGSLVVFEKALGRLRGRSLRRVMVFGITLAALVLASEHVSLYCSRQSARAAHSVERRDWARWAHRLAPGAFTALFPYAVLSLGEGSLNTARPLVEALHRTYPYVPAALMALAELHLREGNLPAAKKALRHAVANDPHFLAAQTLLQTVVTTEERSLPSP